MHNASAIAPYTAQERIPGSERSSPWSRTAEATTKRVLARACVPWPKVIASHGTRTMLVIVG